MSRIYMYPKNDYETLESPNPYVPNVESALSGKHIIVNNNPNRIGVFELFLYLFKADIFFFNWIEDVALKRYGKLQFFSFFIFIALAKISRRRIVWVLHNKYSHEKSNRWWSGNIFRLMVRSSDLIITHSEAGIDFLKEYFPGAVKKARYIIHPVDNMIIINDSHEKEYDLLIWGTIHPYKGVIDFLRFANGNEDLKKLRIMVSGFCPDQREKKELEELATGNISHINEFQKIEEVASLASRSRFVLFTYNSASILSSGSLMDSIRMGSRVIGPDKGSFRDLRSYSFVKTYTSFAEIPSILWNAANDESVVAREIEEFCQENTWSRFGQKLFRVSDGIL